MENETQSKELPASPPLLPLCVDLDGTLIWTDLVQESLLRGTLSNPLLIFAYPLWLLRGWAYFRFRLARLARLHPGLLPYNEEFLEFLRAERARGRELFLASASYTGLVGSVAKHLGIFDGVFASTGRVSMSG
ncbi:MAG: haloacid dehalogenase-like hydrolase, partial [Planctomycetes bacterium]|nr:haloacid dehalogenase-like hydrolase [Planctomycetota bacterium]